MVLGPGADAKTEKNRLFGFGDTLTGDKNDPKVRKIDLNHSKMDTVNKTQRTKNILGVI